MFPRHEQRALLSFRSPMRPSEADRPLIGVHTGEELVASRVFGQEWTTNLPRNLLIPQGRRMRFLKSVDLCSSRVGLLIRAEGLFGPRVD